MSGDAQIERALQTRKFLDRTLNPPAYVDEEVPSVTVKLPVRSQRGRKYGTHQGTYYISGTHYDFGPGTFGLRVTRLSVFAGSRETFWGIRHSRQGTIDIIYFPAAGQEIQLGNGMKPVYSLGAGTVTMGFMNEGSPPSSIYQNYHLEGIVSRDG